MKEVVLTVRDFRKTYGNFTAVDGISFELGRGEVLGLLGPNGAGKTSTLECLEGLRRSDGGELNILGVDPGREARRLPSLIGVQLQTSGLPPTMRVDEALRFFCAYHGIAPRYDLLERLGLGEKRRNQYVELSIGQQRRLALALAIAHRPAIIILDEPTAGLDVASRAELHAMLEELQHTGTSVLLATHDMAEAEKLADRVAILLKGKIVATGTPREITAASSTSTKILVRTDRRTLLKNNVAFPAVSQHSVKEDYATYFSTDAGPTVSAILTYIDAQRDRLIDLRVERPSLEERFLELTQPGGSK